MSIFHFSYLFLFLSFFLPTYPVCSWSFLACTMLIYAGCFRLCLYFLIWPFSITKDVWSRENNISGFNRLPEFSIYHIFNKFNVLRHLSLKVEYMASDSKHVNLQHLNKRTVIGKNLLLLQECYCSMKIYTGEKS